MTVTQTAAVVFIKSRAFERAVCCSEIVCYKEKIWISNPGKRIAGALFTFIFSTQLHCVRGEVYCNRFLSASCAARLITPMRSSDLWHRDKLAQISLTRTLGNARSSNNCDKEMDAMPSKTCDPESQKAGSGLLAREQRTKFECQ